MANKCAGAPLSSILLLALIAFGAAAAEATAPPGPRLAVEVSRPYPGLSGIETVGPAGEDPQAARLSSWCRRTSRVSTLLSIKRGHYDGVDWQPGPGRGAGPIAC
jgi:hypothetical protein